MPFPTIKRPRKLLELSWPWVVLAVAGSGAALVAAYLGIRLIQERAERSGRAAFLLISSLGGLALLLILVTFFYTLRKRGLQEAFYRLRTRVLRRRGGGSMMSWLKSHVYLGLLALAAALAHASVFASTSGVTTGKVALGVLLLLVVSGILWRIVYARVPPRVAGDVANLAIRDTHERVERLRVELEKLTVGKSPPFQRAVSDLVAHQGSPEAFEREIAAADPAERAAWDRIKELAARIDRERDRESKQRRYARLMQGWKAVHLPLAAILLGVVFAHVYDVFNVDRLFAGEAEKRFASSQDCARCHASIVDEWKLSMHRNAQTSTITVAQTRLALGKSPNFKQLCVNCHAPIGSKFSQKATFPLSAPDPGTDPQAVGDEGVSCSVCHAMPRPPAEIAGAGDLPLGERSATSFGVMFGPPLEKPRAIPASAHEVAVGFMEDSVSASQLCAACHNVKADIDGDGLVAAEFAAAVAAAGDKPADSDGDGILDENELDVVDGRLQDLVLQTTFDEWEDYQFASGGKGASCVDCHMPRAENAPLIDAPPPGFPSAARVRQRHVFVGVDYDLNIAYYARPGMPEKALVQVLEEREKLLAQAATVSVAPAPSAPGRLTAAVEVKALEGHGFPTGFAFARQFWLEVSARTASGKPVCLAADPHGIASPCASGKIEKPDEDLATCDPAPLGLGNKEIRFAALSPLDRCDPWLANFQKILTDGDPDGDGILNEVAYQSLLPDIVKLRVRTADQQPMASIPSGKSAKFNYEFDFSQAGGEPVQVRALLRHRHLPPHFVRALDGSYPPRITAAKLLRNMTVVDVASNEPLGKERTNPSPESLDRRAQALAAPGGGSATRPWTLLPVLGLVAVAPLLRRRLRRP